MKVSGIEVVAQFCVDPEKSKAWYTDFLGAETTQYPSPLFVLGGSTLLLAPGTPGTGRGGTGVYFHVASVDEAYKELTARGYKFNEEPYGDFRERFYCDRVCVPRCSSGYGKPSLFREVRWRVCKTQRWNPISLFVRPRSPIYAWQPPK